MSPTSNNKKKEYLGAATRRCIVLTVCVSNKLLNSETDDALSEL